MPLTVTAVLACLLLLGILGLFAVTLVRGPTDVVLIFLLVAGLFYAFRPVLFILGLDVPEPEALFNPPDEAADLTVTALGISVFLLAMYLATRAVLRSGLRGFGPFFTRSEPSLARLQRVTVGFTVVATLISGYLLLSHGGVGSVLSAAKVDKAFAGLFVLKVAPSMGAVVGMATALEAFPRRRPRPFVLGLGCGFLNAAYVFLWGSRQMLVVVVAILVVGIQRRYDARSQLRRPVLGRLLVSALLVIGLAGGLRMVRDQFINGQVQPVYADAGLARRASLGTNAVYFDAAMLAFRDWPRHHPFRQGHDLVLGLEQAVPRKLWPGKPTDVVPGAWFRQIYDPTAVNGWPMGDAALWYLNFGWLGLAVGGIGSGILLGGVALAQRRRPENGFNTASAMVTGVFVISTGLDGGLLASAVIWWLPLWLIARYVTVPVQPLPALSGTAQAGPAGQAPCAATSPAPTR
jgi:hypothetical protein